MLEPRIARNMQVFTADGEYIGLVRDTGSVDFELERGGSGEAGLERIPAEWVDRVDQHVHLNRTGAEAVAGWKSARFVAPDSSAAAAPPATQAARPNWIVWAIVAVALVLLLVVLF